MQSRHRSVLHSHLHLDGLVWLVVQQCEVISHKVINAHFPRIEHQARKMAWSIQQLLLEWLHMICVNVSVTQNMNELARLQVAHLHPHFTSSRHTSAEGQALLAADRCLSKSSRQLCVFSAD